MRQRAYATYPTKQNASAPNTVADTRCATGVRRRGRPRFPVGEISHHSNGESACAIRCTGRTPPRVRIVLTPDRRSRVRRRAASVQALAALGHPPKDLGCPVTPMNGELMIAMPRCRELDPSDHSRRHRWISQSAGWGPGGDAHHHSDVAMEPDRHYLLRLALSCGFRQSATLLWGPIKRRQSCKTSIRSEDRAVRRCRARRVRPSMADRCRSVSADLGGAFH